MSIIIKLGSLKVYCLLTIILIILSAIAGIQQKHIETKEKEVETLKTQVHQLQNSQEEMHKMIEDIKKDTESLKQAKMMKDTQVVVKSQQRASMQVSGQYKELCDKYFGSQSLNCQIMVQRESGGNPLAVSRTDDHGLAQLHCPLWCNFFGKTREELKDPETNIKLAKVVYDRSGWSAWTTMR